MMKGDVDDCAAEILYIRQYRCICVLVVVV